MIYLVYTTKIVKIPGVNGRPVPATSPEGLSLVLAVEVVGIVEGINQALATSAGLQELGRDIASDHGKLVFLALALLVAAFYEIVVRIHFLKQKIVKLNKIARKTARKVAKR
jgi:hypothetical protein